jgi:hypothetical protein
MAAITETKVVAQLNSRKSLDWGHTLEHQICKWNSLTSEKRKNQRF